VLILGLDGASWNVLRPLLERGELPHLARWIEQGQSGPLPSTTPPMTFPAWSALLTGRGPGEHGLFDFTQKLPGAYRIRFTNARDRAGETLLAAVSRAGGRVLCLGMPGTYPPDPVSGLIVPGFDAPISTGSTTRATSDPALYARIAERVGPWMLPAAKEHAPDDAWHERNVDTLLARIARKQDFALEAIRLLREQGDGARPDLAVVIFSESDTVAHHYWRDFDPLSPRHDPGASPRRKGAVAAVYRRLDEACGRIREAFGTEALCLVLSDHGSGGASHRILHVGKRLEDCDLLRRRRTSGAPTLDNLAQGVRGALLQHLPSRLAQAVFRRLRPAAARVESAARFGGIDWGHTVAFCEEANTQPGVWINLAGREARGCVAPGDYPKVCQGTINALCDWKLPGGEPAIAWAKHRDEVYAGPYVQRVPDIVFEPALDAGYALSLVPTPWAQPGIPAIETLSGPALAGGRGRGMNGTHRKDGIWIATGGKASLARPSSIVGVAAVVFDALGIAPSGCARDDDEPTSPGAPYTKEEERLVAQRLKALGYLE